MITLPIKYNKRLLYLGYFAYLFMLYTSCAILQFQIPCKRVKICRLITTLIYSLFHKSMVAVSLWKSIVSVKNFVQVESTLKKKTSTRLINNVSNVQH